jgi:hypothetical protein
VTENEISKEIVDDAIRVHRDLGPYLFESVYKGVMASALDGLQDSLCFLCAFA